MCRRKLEHMPTHKTESAQVKWVGKDQTLSMQNVCPEEMYFSSCTNCVGKKDVHKLTQ